MHVSLYLLPFLFCILLFSLFHHPYFTSSFSFPLSLFLSPLPFPFPFSTTCLFSLSYLHYVPNTPSNHLLRLSFLPSRMFLQFPDSLPSDFPFLPPSYFLPSFLPNAKQKGIY